MYYIFFHYFASKSWKPVDFITFPANVGCMAGPDERKGYLICIEGIDGAGKSTQIQQLANWFRGQGIEAALLKEPTSGPYGREIARRAIAHEPTTPEEELQLFLKDRQEDAQKNILPALGEGRVVIMDRYYPSNMAYQGARGLDPAAIEKKNRRFAPEPDLVIVLDIDPAAGLERIRNGRKGRPDAFEKEEYLRKVRAIFLDLGRRPNGAIVDASGPQESVHKAIVRTVRERMPARFFNK